MMTETIETMLRGTKIRIYPNQHARKKFDLWRQRCTRLWNLLLELEQAAYSGEARRPEIGWRSIWAKVIQESHDEAVRIAREGKQRKDGTWIKKPGERQEPPPLDEEVLAKINRQIFEDVIDPKTGETITQPAAKLFFWEHEAQKIMARLKKVPQTHWIDDLPSHAAQSVVKDLIKALQAMLRERKKRASGADGRDTGFPKFKQNRYAAGSVYFANTQIRFDFEKHRIKFPNGCDWVTYHPESLSKDFHQAKLMGGRIWRQGEDWFLSCQWERKKPEPLPETGRTAGVKIGASVLLTTFDNRGQTREYFMPPPDKKLIAQHKAAGKKLARAAEGHKRKAAKLHARKLWQREKAASEGKTPGPLAKPRLKRSRSHFETSARLAELHARETNARDDVLHQLTTKIVKSFDAIAVQKFEVARLMKKSSKRRDKREARSEEGLGKREQKRDLKPVRKLMRHVAMARCMQLLEYKYKDLRGENSCQIIDKFDANVHVCSSCGAIHPDWKDGRRIVRCDAVLADGTVCGNNLLRNRNAARVSKRELDAHRRYIASERPDGGTGHV